MAGKQTMSLFPVPQFEDGFWFGLFMGMFIGFLIAMIVYPIIFIRVMQ